MADPPPTTELIAALQGVLRQVAEPTAVLRTILEQAVSRTAAERGLFVEVTEGGGARVPRAARLRAGALRGRRRPLQPQPVRARARDRRRTCCSPSVTRRPDARRGRVRRAAAQGGRSCACRSAPRRAIARAGPPRAPRAPATSPTGTASGSRALLEVAGPVLETLQAGRDGPARARPAAHLRDAAAPEAEESRRQLASRLVVRPLRRPLARRCASWRRRCARSRRPSFPVLLLGETGTGKSILARVIHYDRAARRAAVRHRVLPVAREGHGRGRAVRPPARRVHRRGRATASARSRRPTAARCSSTRSASCRSRSSPSCCGCSRSRPTSARRRQGAARRRADHRGDQPRPRARGRRGPLPARPLRAAQLRAGARAAAARAHRGPAAAAAPRARPARGRPLDRDLAPRPSAACAELDFAWPGNVRHLEQLAARLSLARARAPRAVDAGEELLARCCDRGARGSAGGAPARADLVVGAAVAARGRRARLARAGAAPTIPTSRAPSWPAASRSASRRSTRSCASTGSRRLSHR